MTRPAKSIFAFGLWALIAGLGLLTMPNFLLSIVDLKVLEPVYVRIIGFILIEISIFYLFIAQKNIENIFPVTIYIRLIPVVALTLFVVTAYGPWQLILFALVDAASALHTWHTLKKKSSD